MSTIDGDGQDMEVRAYNEQCDSEGGFFLESITLDKKKECEMRCELRCEPARDLRQLVSFRPERGHTTTASTHAKTAIHPTRYLVPGKGKYKNDTGNDRRERRAR